MTRHRRGCAAPRTGLLLAALIALPASAPAGAPPEGYPRLAREILSELVEIETVAGAGTTPEAAGLLAERLRQAGLPAADIRVLGPAPDLGNLVARLRGNGSGGPPVLLMAHLDVVPASPIEWAHPPFRLSEADGFLYGRGTLDVKSGAAILVANLIRFLAEGYVPDRDVIVLLTADEETDQRSIEWLLREQRALVDAAFALNTDGGLIVQRAGRKLAFMLQASEKVYLNLRVEVEGTGGHSSLPTPDNAIHHLARALARLAEFQFPVHLDEVTRSFFERQLDVEPGPYTNAMQRTTCIATEVGGGHAENALPELAWANVNCRVLPHESVDDVEATLRRVLADERIRMTRTWTPLPSPPSPLDPDIIGPIERLVEEMFPGIPVIPEMSTGATDGAFTRNAGIPTYGVSAFALDPNDDRAHGTNERLATQSFYDALEFWYRMVRALTSR